MDNKNEKTFADLFSSSSSKDLESTKSFSDILNASSNDTEKETEKDSEMTFDNLFDKIPEKEIKEETVSVNPEEPTQEIPTTTENFNFDSIFSKKEENEPIINTEEKQIEEPIEENKIEQSEELTSNFNPFMEAKEEPKVTEMVEANGSNTLQNNVEEKPIEEKENENPFFQNNSLEEVTLTNNTERKETTIEELNSNNNPFINSESTDNTPTTQEENKLNLQPTSESQIEINPIFKETPQAQEQENPFFETSNNNSVASPIMEEINNKELKENTPQENIPPKSTSPFFEEEKKSEENPFFQNQLNLIENQVPNGPSSNIDTSKTKHYNVKIVKKKEPLIKFILGVISYALFIWLLLIGVTLLIYVLDIKIRAAKGDYSAPTFNAYVVLTGSMLPEIQVYDVVVTKKVEAKKLKEGDVITFASADQRFLGTIITHRIIKKNPPSGTDGYTFQTRGDNNNVADSALVPENNIYGKVILKIPKLGYLQEFLASDGGWIIVILIPCLTVISYDTVKLIKGLKRKKYKNIKVQK